MSTQPTPAAETRPRHRRLIVTGLVAVAAVLGEAGVQLRAGLTPSAQ